VPTEPCAGAPRCEPIGTNRGASQGKMGCGGRLFDYPYRQVLPLANQCITDMGGQQGLEPMIRLTTDHHRTTMARVCRFENVKDDILGVDRVHNLRLHGVLSHACLMENLLRTREHGFGRLRNGLDPAGLFCFEARLFSLFLLRILRAAEFQEFSGQWW
jgi:hypothetical protein